LKEINFLQKGDEGFMKMGIVKKNLLLSLGFGIAIFELHADVAKLKEALVRLQGSMQKLVSTLNEPGLDKGKLGAKDFSGKIDYLEIPTFEAFYRAFVDQYFNKAFAESRVGKLGLGSIPAGLTSEDLINMKDVIGRAIFERNILKDCRKYIDMNDMKPGEERKQSGENPLWVYTNYLKGVIDNVLAAHADAATQQLLEGTAQAIAQAVDDMFIHRERDPVNNLVSCSCLSLISHQGCRVELGLHQRIPLFQGIEFLKKPDAINLYAPGTKVLDPKIKKMALFKPDNTFKEHEIVIIKQSDGEYTFAFVLSKLDGATNKWWVLCADLPGFLTKVSAGIHNFDPSTLNLSAFATQDLGKLTEIEFINTLGEKIVDEGLKKRAKFAPDNIFDVEEIVLVEQQGSAGEFIIAQVKGKSTDVKAPWIVQVNGLGTRVNFSTQKLGKLKHPLALPIAYLVFETMHTTLFHGLLLTDRLIALFDFTRDLKAEVVIKNKTKFKVGYDEVFEDMMKHIVKDEDTIKAGLFIGNQLKYDGTELKLLFLGQTEPQTRMVIFGKKPDTYWSQHGDSSEKWPDKTPRLNTVEYEKKPRKEELLYAVWYQLWRHTCYSVGLLPENIISVLNLSDEVRSELTKIEAERHVNKAVKEDLVKKANALLRVPPIVAYLLPKLKTVKKGIGAKTEVFNIINNIDEDKAANRAQLLGITEDEWIQIASKLAEDPAYDSKIKWIFEDAVIKKNITDNLKKKDPAAERMFAAFYSVNKSRLGQ